MCYIYIYIYIYNSWYVLWFHSNPANRLLLLLLLLLPLALEPTVGFGQSKNVLPFFPICHQLSSSSHSQHFKIFFYFFFPSFPGSSPSFRAFQFLSEDFLGILSSSILSRWPNQPILCPFIHFTILPANRQSTKKHNTYQLLYIYSTPPDDGLQIYPKHVEVDWRNKLRINSASSWFLLHRCIEMHGQQNIKKKLPVI